VFGVTAVTPEFVLMSFESTFPTKDCFANITLRGLQVRFRLLLEEIAQEIFMLLEEVTK
jgi:hypothetical protein